MSTNNSTEPAHLQRSLGPFMLWGLGVGLVISGMYFGWNLGLEKGGSLGFAIATFFVIILYITFTFSYAELACAIPKAGGAFDYANQALGKRLGFICGVAQLVEFVFAPPAIAAAIGAYFHIYFSTIPVLVIAMIAYILFTGLNIIGLKPATLFELTITILAVAELLIFAGITLPRFQVSNLSINAFPNGYAGIFASVPFAIWFFLAIEGVANLAEETIHPQKNVRIGLSWAIATLVILCILTFGSAVGVNGWETIVYSSTGETSDSPLPLALAQVAGNSGWMYHLLVSIGLLGLVASFHGIILAAGRATFEFGRVGYAPKALGKVHPRFKTPAYALVINMFIGMIALLTGKTGEIITIACFGAITLYIISMISLFALRKNAPQLPRPYRVPFYPWFPMIALITASIALIAMCVYNSILALIYFAMLAAAYIGFQWLVNKKEKKYY